MAAIDAMIGKNNALVAANMSMTGKKKRIKKKMQGIIAPIQAMKFAVNEKVFVVSGGIVSFALWQMYTPGR